MLMINLSLGSFHENTSGGRGLDGGNGRKLYLGLSDVVLVKTRVLASTVRCI